MLCLICELFEDGRVVLAMAAPGSVKEDKVWRGIVVDAGLEVRDAVKHSEMICCLIEKSGLLN